MHMKTCRKLLAALAILFALLTALVGCGADAEVSEPEYDPEKLALNTISRAELTDRERLLMGNSRGTSFVFDFNADESYGELAMWMERYDFGVLAEDRVLNMSSTLRSDEDGTASVSGTIVFSMTPIAGEDGEQSGMSTMRVAVSNGHGNSAISIPPIETPETAMLSGSNLDAETPVGGIIELAQIGYSTASGGQMEFSVTAGDDEESMKQNDITYKLKCEFIKKTKPSGDPEKSATIADKATTPETSAPLEDTADNTGGGDPHENEA